MKPISYKPWILFALLLAAGTIAALARPAAADSQYQAQYATPTADIDGRVIYKVVEGDDCTRIYLLTGVEIETLRTLNKLDQSCTINPGQELLLKIIVPEATATPNPNITATPQLPTPTAIRGTGKICVYLYNDVNGNATHDDTEFVLAGGAVSISDRLGTVSQTGNTTDSVDPLCNDVPEGEYNISMGVPSGYNGTTLLNQVLQIHPGETAILEFGAQVSSSTEGLPAAAETPAPSDNNLLLAILGGVLVLGGIGLGGYILLTRGK